MTKADYDHYDHIVVMDTNNLNNIKRIVGNDKQGKVCRLLDFTDQTGDIADPWYTRDFELTWKQVRAGCSAFLAWLRA